MYLTLILWSSDVSSVGYMSIFLVFMNFEPLVVEEAVVLLMELLEVLSQEVRAETA